MIIERGLSIETQFFKESLLLFQCLEIHMYVSNCAAINSIMGDGASVSSAPSDNDSLDL